MARSMEFSSRPARPTKGSPAVLFRARRLADISQSRLAVADAEDGLGARGSGAQRVQAATRRAAPPRRRADRPVAVRVRRYRGPAPRRVPHHGGPRATGRRHDGAPRRHGGRRGRRGAAPSPGLEAQGCEVILALSAVHACGRAPALARPAIDPHQRKPKRRSCRRSAAA